jgi:hypothetical protein
MGNGSRVFYCKESIEFIGGVSSHVWLLQNNWYITLRGHYKSQFPCQICYWLDQISTDTDRWYEAIDLENVLFFLCQEKKPKIFLNHMEEMKIYIYVFIWGLC